ncbi:Subtilisin-like protease SBT3.5 [Vitis vinifera]|uniref:Subtilisin-like protease SBT3.5 n=1 Tax=Vitis vinifera TaxID=29760 RepID=A0A438HWW5_VITVI|nr:Subtilisin-like protease SBT3.5 [Vitis vinifera]
MAYMVHLVCNGLHPLHAQPPLNEDLCFTSEWQPEQKAYSTHRSSYKQFMLFHIMYLQFSLFVLVLELPDVVQVMPSRLHKLKTTRSWDYLGLSSSHSSTNLLHETNMGDGIIIGLLDSGIWPESKVFSDKGLGPIPSRWKGGCSSGQSFNATKHCNRKLIGAHALGHGTHTSSIAGGSPVVNASYYGLGFGTVRGGAPGARLAMYKTCWNLGGGFCSDADILKAFDKAIHDGVDVLSVSLGSDDILFTEIIKPDSILIGSFHAVAQGISVVCAAGNGGPSAQTVDNTAPWILTVAASSIDRSFPTPITLGNNRTVMGQAMLIGNHTGFASLVYPDDPHVESPRALLIPCPALSLRIPPLGRPTFKMDNCLSISPNDTSVAGKVALCFTSGTFETQFAASFVKEARGLGVIIAENSGNTQASCISDFPCIKVSYETGSQILHYISSTRHPHVRLSPSKTHVGKPVPTNVAYFSSRGPSFPSPAVLKPCWALNGTARYSRHCCTAQSLHPHWSPAAIKSAIVTTGWTTDPSGEPIFAEGDPTKLADPFDFGGGIVNPNRAADPGLVYDMGTADYIHYLCTLGYNNSAIFQFTEQSIRCPTREHSILDLNLPSITIPSLQNSTSLTRNVTNVGAVNSTYKASIISPAGTTITVKPDTLIFDSTIKTVTFSVTVSSIQQVNTDTLLGA